MIETIVMTLLTMIAAACVLFFLAYCWGYVL